jgi:hypothetical protein
LRKINHPFRTPKITIYKGKILVGIEIATNMK